MCRKNVIMCIFFSLWTISGAVPLLVHKVQTGGHLVFVIYAYFMSICQRLPTQDATIFFYLTYLYNRRCSVPVLKDSESLNFESLETYALSLLKYPVSVNDTNTLEGIVTELLNNIDLFPDYANASSRTSVFLLSFIILDGTWIVSAVALFMGASFGIKQSASIAFYGPWLIMTVCMSIFDVSATVAFGLDIPKTKNFANWFNFVGISETSEFEDFEDRDLPFYIPLAPTLALCSLSTRFIIIWISNWIGFVYVLRAAISAYRKPYKNEPRTHYSHSSPSHRSQMDLDSSAARIRNWQLFYGAIETTSSHSSKSTHSERDLNSNSQVESRDEDVEMQRVSSVSANVSNFYYAYPDVAESIDAEGGNILCLEELRSQLPWSYIPVQENNRKSNNELCCEENKTRRNYRLKSDSSASGTEL